MWMDSENKITLVFLPGSVLSLDELFHSHLPKVKSTAYYSCHHMLGGGDATHHGFYCFNSHGTQKWTLFHKTFWNFLKSLKPLLFLVEQILISVCWMVGLEICLQLPSWYGLFGTIWTIMVYNPSCSEWHFNPGDFRIAALLYFGEFSNKELELGAPFSKIVPVRNRDLIFINSSETYHKSLSFLGNRVNLIFYSSVIKKRNMTIKAQ
jgi:hypothetical protein